MQARQGIYSTFLQMRYLLPIIILIEGFASIAIEILTIRQLLPVAGGSVIVTSLIIGIFLLFLAIGYERGGHVKTELHEKLRRNFVIAAIWVGVGLSYIFINSFFTNIEKIVGKHIVYSLVAYLLIIIAPAIYLLGQTLPITMNIVRQDKMTGVIAGKVLGISTIGSFLGATFTTLILMQYVGVAWTVFLTFALLIILTLLLSHTMTSFWRTFILALVAGIVIYAMNVSFEKSTFKLTNTYANYSILTSKTSSIREDEKYLIINGVFNSYTNKRGEVFPYVEMIAKVIYDDLQLVNADILVLGAGGFTLSQNDAGGNHFTYVDIDSQIKQVVVPDFIPVIKDNLVIDDARHYLVSTDKKFAVIVVDTYSSLHAIPAHLVTREFMLSIKHHLIDQGGYAIFNIIADPFFTDAYSKRIDNTIRSVFGSCAVLPFKYANQETNIIYACSHLTHAQDKVVYTDDKNSSTTDSFAW